MKLGQIVIKINKGPFCVAVTLQIMKLLNVNFFIETEELGTQKHAYFYSCCVLLANVCRKSDVYLLYCFFQLYLDHVLPPKLGRYLNKSFFIYVVVPLTMTTTGSIKYSYKKQLLDKDYNKKRNKIRVHGMNGYPVMQVILSVCRYVCLCIRETAKADVLILVTRRLI